MVVVATTVFACTNFVGAFTVTGISGSQTATGNDTCTDYTMTSTCTFNMAQTLSGTEATTSHTTSGQFSISWTVSTGGGGNPDIASAIAGTYEVRFVDGDAYDNQGSWKIDCMAGSSGQTLTGTNGSTTLSGVTGTLSGSTSFKIPSGQVANSTSPDQESAVCISDSAANFGNEAPIELT